MRMITTRQERDIDVIYTKRVASREKKLVWFRENSVKSERTQNSAVSKLILLSVHIIIIFKIVFPNF